MQTDLDKSIEKLKNGELLKEKDVKQLCAKIREIFIEEGNVQRIDPPVIVVGDIHGQLYDLFEIFKQSGEVGDQNYLFLGDYVNRGFHSIESICLLYALKIKNPDKITLLRGNHESRILTQTFGLYDEAMRKYGSLNIWRYLTESFDYMPLSALIDEKIWCVHGGIAQDAKLLDDVRALNRLSEIPDNGEICELLWNDPNEQELKGFGESKRGVGKEFGQDVFTQFLQTNNLSCVLRAHQVIMEGYRSIYKDQLKTIFSAPNYCYRCGNSGAVCEVSDKLEMRAKIFQASENQMKNAQTKIWNQNPDYFL
ncbi:unnamed protein product [Paramecium pentaurelia]|uniref:Serine/threonine-protein phosphatase n=1 Tax=Paramecium pentaurelia TaxID=43138 RepID=A0A8S1Y0X5_9CILI|nr:unnamed protein product [Paramecium pentaurelia]